MIVFYYYSIQKDRLLLMFYNYFSKNNFIIFGTSQRIRKVFLIYSTFQKSEFKAFVGHRAQCARRTPNASALCVDIRHKNFLEKIKRVDVHFYNLFFELFRCILAK